MLSVTEEHWPEIHVREHADVEGGTGQELIFRVGPVFSMGKPVYGIWVNYDSGDNLNGPVLVDYKSWKTVNRKIRRDWRRKTWRIFKFSENIHRKISSLDIRLL